MKSRARAARLLALSGLAGALVLMTPAPAHAVVAAAGPGAFATGYATRVVVTPAGGPVTFMNGDAVADHTLTAADATLPKKVAKRTKRCRGYSVRSCPLFATPVVGPGGSAAVEGLKRVKPGQYEFKCQIHGSMTGTLVVAGAGSR